MAKKIYETAESYGIGREDLLIDALCMTVSSDPNERPDDAGDGPADP